MQLTFEQILEYIILGIDNGNYEASKNLAIDTLEYLKKEKHENNNNQHN